MNEKKFPIQYELFAGILFALTALNSLNLLIKSFNLMYLLSAAGYLLIAAMFFIKQKDITIAVGFSLVGLSKILGIFVASAKFIYILYSIAYILMLAVPLAFYCNYISEYKEKFKKIYFVPALCIGVACVINFIRVLSLSIMGAFGFVNVFTSSLFVIIEAVALLCASVAIVFPDGIPVAQFKTGLNTTEDSQMSINGMLPPEAYCSMVKHILLLLFTFGIWNLIWVYKVTYNLNSVKDESPRNPTTKLLLYMFVPFYSIYWIYKSAQRVDKLAKEKNLPSDSATLCLILAIFIPIVSLILLQDKINNIITTNGTAQAHQQSNINTDIATELKSYKDLLDSGVITQEEFELKKKQLLDL